MKNITVWSNSLVPMTAVQGDPASVSATLVLVPETGDVIEHTAAFETVDDEVVADLTFTAPEAETETVYDYYVKENFDSEPSLIYPDPNNCDDGECELPTITVCPLEEAETS